MIEVRQTAEFSGWLRRLRDGKAKARIAARIERMKLGNLGDCKSPGGGLMEIRVAYGPATAFTSCVKMLRSFSCSVAATNARSSETSGEPMSCWRTCDEDIAF